MNTPGKAPGRASGETSGLPGDAWPRIHDRMKLVARVIHSTAFRIHTQGLQRVPRTGPVVLVANHSSLVEPQVIYGWLPRRAVFLIKEELDVGLTGWGLRRIGQVPVHRGGANREALTQAKQVLARDGVVCVFPEGKRGSGNVTAVEGGAAWLARASGAVILPLATRGTLRPKESGRRFRPRIDLLVGEPLTLRIGPGRQGLDHGSELIRRELAGLVKTLDGLREQDRRSTDETGEATA